jgi:hypothetical protein
MKKYILFSVLSVLINITLAQTAPPNGMIYQAVARDGSGNLAAKRTIYVQTTVLKGSATGTVMYSDEHKVTSNADAMFTVIVGQGTYLSGIYSKLANIPWDKDKYFFNLKICVAPTLPKTGWNKKYTDMGTTQFWSVPYALFAGKSSDSLELKINSTERQIKLGNYQPIYFSVADDDSNATNEIQQLSISGGRLKLSLNGGLITLPDSNALNELQNISRTGGRLLLSQNGGVVSLPDSSDINEIQTISRTGGRINLSLNGGMVTLPDSSDINEIQTISRTGGRINLSLNGGMVTLPDSTVTNEIQTLRLKSDSLLISSSNGVDLYPILGAGTVKMKDYKIPDGLVGMQKIKYTIIPVTTTSTPPSSTTINPYTVPTGKNLYIRKVTLSTPFWQCSAGLYVNGNLVIPTAGVGCGIVYQEPVLAGAGMVVTVDIGCGGSSICSSWYCDIEGYLVDKTVTVVYEKTGYTVPSGNVFVKVTNTANFPEIFNAGETVPANTNGYLLRK